MKIHEYQAKELLREYGAPVPGGYMVTTPEGAKEAIRKFFKGKSDNVIALNEKAFDLGYEKGIELREER